MPDFLKPHDNLLPPDGKGKEEDSRHDASDHPFSKTADALRAAAESPSEPIDSSVHQAQRAALIEKAKLSMNANPSSKREPAKEPQESKWSLAPYLTWLRWSAGIGAIALLLVVGASYLLQLGSGGRLQTGPGGVVALSIPAARAADAFSVHAERGDAAGMDTDASWIVRSKVSVTKNDLTQALSISPSVPVTVESIGGGEYRVSPTEQLEGGKVYSVKLAAAIEDTERGTVGREFSWAFQTKDSFRVLSTIPADASGGVPVDTGIEFKFTRPGFEDPTGAFSIQPPVSGTFETRGRYLTFVPDEPLQTGQKYEVVLNRGFGVENSDLALEEDVRIRFETAPTGGIEARQPLSHDEFIDVRPGEDIRLRVSSGREFNDTESIDVNVTGFALTKEEAASLMAARLAVPEWAFVERTNFDAYESRATRQAFTADATVELQAFEEVLRMPAVATPGFYAVRLRSAGRPDSWMLVQATQLAYYVTSDEDRMLVWTVNASTNQPLANTRLALPGEEARTNERGTGTITAPDFLSERQDPNAPGYAVLDIGEGELTALVPVVRRYSIFGSFRGDFWWRQYDENVWSYLYLDRPLYRVSDELHFFGLAQDRASKAGVGALKARIVTGGFWLYGDAGSGEQKVYAETSVQTDAAGRFEGVLSWDRLTPNRWYSLEIMDGDTLVLSKSFEVREISKPSFFIDVSADRENIYGGEAVNGSVQVRFYSGAPLPNARLRMTVRQGNDDRQFDLTTDEFGMAGFQFPSVPVNCPLPQERPEYCASLETMVIQVMPVEGEQGETVGTEQVNVYSGALGIETRTDKNENRARIEFDTYRRDFSSEDGKGDAWPGRVLTGRVFARYWERIQVGERYDFVLKRVVPTYRYEERFDAPQNFTVTTDASGNAAYEFAVDPGREYQVIVNGQDDAGRATQAQAWVYAQFAQTDTPQPNITFDNAASEIPSYSVGESVEATFRLGEEPVRTQGTPGVLFLLASRGMIRHAVSDAPNYSFAYEERMLPNVELIGVAFVDGVFIEARNTAQYAQEERELTIELQADQEEYAPGAEVEVRVLAKRASDGAPVENAVVAYGAVDRSLLALAYTEPANPLADIYKYVGSGLVFTQVSTEAKDARLSMAEGGGGGLDAFLEGARRTFKDTAAFGTVLTDGSGAATIRFTVPDNLTSWRVEAVAITDALYAGSAQTDVRVTKPVFVEAVLPPRLLQTDEPVVKLRAFGTGLPEGAMAFRIHAPTLGLEDERVEATAGQAVYISPERLPLGRHTITVGVEANGQTDAVERTIEVVSTRYLHDEYVSVEAAPGVTLPETEGAEATVMFLAQNRASLLPIIQSALRRDLPRADAQIASAEFNQILRNAYGRSELSEESFRLSDYQDFTGGIKLLPYSTPELELSAEVAQTSPALVDAEALANYLWQRFDDPEADDSERIIALSGLAAMQEPVLAALQERANDESLEWELRLWIARGLEAAGDRELASRELNELLEQYAEASEGAMFLNVSGEAFESYEATADAAALAAALAHPDALALMRYVERHVEEDAFPVLAKVRYVKSVLPTLLPRDISLTYSVSSSQSETLTFQQESVITRTFTQAELARLVVTRVDGPVDMVFVRRVEGRPEAAGPVSISRSYTGGQNGVFREGDVVQVNLTARWNAGAEEGCYVIRDHLPGSWEALMNWRVTEFDVRGWFPVEVENGEVTLYACKQEDGTENISYPARIVSRGSYTAEAPLIQHMEFPGIASLGTDQTVIVE